jgi:hypothetical protein
MPPKRLSTLITSDGQLLRLAEKASLLAQMQRVLEKNAPAELARTCVIANVRESTVIIHAATNAAAARIRLLLPRLLAALQQSSPHVNSARVEVQIPTSPTNGARQKRMSVISARTGESLTTLAQSLPTSRLRDAVDALARRSRER